MLFQLLLEGVFVRIFDDESFLSLEAPLDNVEERLVFWKVDPRKHWYELRV